MGKVRKTSALRHLMLVCKDDRNISHTLRQVDLFGFDSFGFKNHSLFFTLRDVDGCLPVKGFFLSRRKECDREKAVRELLTVKYKMEIERVCYLAPSLSKISARFLRSALTC
jgi:hypothetical protein